MSFSSVLSPESDQSDSRILIEACLARVRQEAGLDVEPVLPPLDALLGKSDAPPRDRVVVSPSAQQLPSAEAIVKASVRPAAVTTAKIDRPDTTKTLARRLRWPVLLCGFVAGISGGVAIMKSPVGQKPAVQHVVKKVQSHVEGAYAVTVATTSRLVKR